MKILLITPPLTQLNTPYPATMVLKGFLKTLGHQVEQMDLGIELVDRIYSKKGLTEIFRHSEKKSKNEAMQFIFDGRDDYVNCVDTVMRFLRGKDQTIAGRIASHTLLPEGPRFENLIDTEMAFGLAGKSDEARYLATRYIEDIADYIREMVSPHFDLVRYAEHLGSYAPKFDKVDKSLKAPLFLTDEWMLQLLDEKIKSCSPQLVGLSIPFPGCLYAALRCAQYIKQNYPEIVVTAGGGYPNTELRQISDVRFFNYVDYLTLDDGELPLKRLCEYLEGKTESDKLVRTYYLDSDRKKIIYSGNDSENVRFADTGTPDFSGLKLDLYISTTEGSNPMHTLWQSGRWNKLVMAHGCYWAKCAFCDVTLDYIRRYDAPSADIVVDRMESVMNQTGESGFHFTDEAMPPRLLKEVALEIKKRRLTVSYWGNIRFDITYTAELCELLSESGMIAASGGLEVASDRLLKLMRKGVTIEQTTLACKHLTDAGIMVHTYLMYGFPTETFQECIDALEVVRQLFANGLVHSAFWHRYAMTVHSPSGQNPKEFGVNKVKCACNSFCNNEIPFEEEIDYDSELMGEGLRFATYNYMHGIGLDFPLSRWFKMKIPRTTVPSNLIEKIIRNDR